MTNSTLKRIRDVFSLMSASMGKGRFLSLMVLLLATAVVAKANPIGLSTAREVGAKFINANTKMTVANPNSLRLVTTYNTSDGTAAFHVFNTERGFVIVAADDCATPILGYSDKGAFDMDNIPPQMQFYLQGFVEQIQYGIEHHLIADANVTQQWSAVRSIGHLSFNRATTAVQPLLTDTWDQGCYYNSLCPEDPDGYCGHVVTGCVATSMAQIMHYWGYPSTGTGSHTYTPSGYPTQTANFGATTYQWANMPNNLSSSSSSTQINAVATLMWHCGVAVEMMYGADGSGAYSEDVATALVNYFGYSNQLTGVYKSNYSNTVWLNMIKSSLDLGRPVHYSGNDGSGQSGHAFVCDGYDSNNLLHFNWGWSGSYNNYFAVDALTPSGYNFSYGNFAIINIFPNCTSGTSYQVTATASPSYGGTVNGSGYYDCGDGCTLTAVPADGYMFCSWTEGDATVSTEPTYSFTVMDNRNIVANFVEASGGSCSLLFTFNDSYGDGWNGNALAVSYSEGCNSYEELTLDNGASTTLIRNVIDGSHIVLGWIEGGWPEECSFTISYENGDIIFSGSNLNSSFSYEFDVNCDGTTPTYYNITATANPTQGGSVSGTGSFTYGEVCTLTASANDNYSFTDWTKNGQVVSTNPTYEFTVTEDADFVANFSYNGGENIIEIGDGTSTTYNTPFNSLWGYSFVEQIYFAEEIGTSATISSIAFNMQSENDQTNDIEVFMKNVSRDSFSSNMDYEPVTASDMVYSGILSFHQGWTTITLDTPFAYDGTSNLLIAMHEYTPGYTTRYFYYTDTPNAVLSHHSDNVNPDPYDLESFNGNRTVSGKRANLQLGITTGGGSELTVYDGTATNNYIPVYGFYADAYLKAEMVYPSSELVAMANTDINSMKFYASTPATDAWTSTFQVFIKEVDEATIDEFIGTDGATFVYEGLLNGTDSEMVIDFSTPYHYNGGNLLVGVYNITTGIYKSIAWVGETVDGASLQGYSYNGLDAIAPTQRNFLPKTTFYYNPAFNGTVDFETGDFSQAEFNNAVSSYPWMIWNDNTHSGNYCMTNGNSEVQSSASYIDVTADFVRDGYISFFSRISSEYNWDFGRFYIDGNEMLNESGVSEWTNQIFEVSAGTHTFRWSYVKDGSVDSDEDRYFIDDIYFDGVSTEANLVVTPNPIDLGYRPNNAWMRPLEVNVFNEGASTTINNVSVTNDYFQLGFGDAVVPFVLHHNNGFDFTIGTEGAASGTVQSNLIINYGNNGETQYDVTAIAYNPVSPDVWELAQTVNSFPFTATLNSANHPLYNNYRLPPTGIVDGADAVYKLVFAEDTYLNASVTTGENGKVALYKEGFNGIGGPDLYNNYTGPEMEIEDWLYYDNGEYATGIGASGSEFWWGIKLDVSAYAGASLTKVSVYDCAYMEGDVMIYQTEGTPSGEPAQQQSITLTGSSQFVEFVLNNPYTIDASQPLWIVMHYISGDSWPAAASDDTGDPNGRWVSLDNYDWQDLTNYGLNYTWMLRGFVTNANGRTMALVNRDDAFDVTIGEETNTTGYHPFYTLFNYSISEQIFLASELANAGANTSFINKLSWYATNAPGFEQQGISIWMANVNYPEIPATSVLTNDMTLVYTGTMTPEVGWNEFVFNEGSFAWDGVSNVLICVQRNNGEWNSTVNWQSHDAGFNASGRLYTDNAPYDMTNEYYNLTLQTARANTRFTFSNDFEGDISNMTVIPGTYYLVASSTSNEWTIEIHTDEVPCPDPAYNPSPANYAEVNPNRTIELSWKLGPRTTEYKLMFGVTENCEQTLVDWTRELSRHYTLPALMDEMTYYWKVVERNDGCETGVESPVWSFTTRLNTPQNLYAEQDFIMEGNSAVLHWSVPNRALQYYNVYQDGVLIGSTTDTYYVVDGLSYNMSGYEFYVTGVFDAGESDPSNDVWVYVSGLGTVNGHIYEQDGVTGIANATVSFTGYDEYGYYNTFNFNTDANGYYEGSLRAGSYVAVASHAGYQDKSYGSYIGIVFNNLTSGININLDELFNPVSDVVAEYYPDVQNPNSPYVKVHWGFDNPSNWLYYDDGVNVDAIGLTAGGSFYWGVMFPAGSYAGNSLTKVSMYDYSAHTGTILVYQGGANTPGTLVGQQAYSCTGSEDFVEWTLNNPVTIDPSQNLWIVMNNNDGQYVASCCINTGDTNGHWISIDGATWEDVTGFGLDYTWMIRAYVTSRAEGAYYAPMSLSADAAPAKFANRIKGRPNNLFSVSGNATAHNVGVPAERSDNNNRAFAYYRVYRTNAYNFGPYTEDNTVLLADNVTDTLLIDVSWQDAEAGVYKWGVSRVYEGNRESEISWGELRRSLSIPKRNPLGRVLNITEEPNAGQAPAFDVTEHTDLPILRASNSEAIVVRNSNYGNDFCQFVLNDPFNLNSYGLSNDAFTRGACYMNGTIYFADNDYKFGKFDPEAGVTIIATNTPFDMIEYNPVNGKIYGTNTWNGELYEVNPVNGSCSYIATIPSSFLMTFTITNDGRFILCDADEECIKEYDLETGELIPLIYVDWDVNYGQDFAIDRETNEIYWAALNNTENTYPLIKVNLANYSLTALGYFETQVSGFAILTDANLIQIERESAITWSNFLDKDMYLNNGDVNLTVALNSGDSPAGTMVSFTNLNTAEQLLYPIDDIVLDGSGYYTWDSFRKGDYQVTIAKEGYATITDNVSIWDATSLSYVLEETTQKPSNLYVSSTGWAKWNGLGNDLNQITSSDSFSIDFDNGIPENWTTIDADGDGYTWVSSATPGDYHNSGVDLTGTGHNSSAHYVISASWANGTGQVLYPDNYLVSPQVTIGAGSTFNFWACAQDASYAADHFGVAISLDGTNFTMLQEWTMTAKGQGAKTVATRSGNRAQGSWYYYTVNLSAYTGQTVYIAIRHFNCSDQFIINVDDVELTDGRDGGRHYEYNQVVLTDLQGNVLYTENTTNKFCQLPVDNLVEGETYHCKVASVYSSGLTEWAEVDWVYQACDNYEGANGLNATTTGDGNLVSWTYPEIERDNTRGSLAYSCRNYNEWVSYDTDNPHNTTALNNISLYGGDYCGLDGYVYSTYGGNAYKVELQTGTIIESNYIGYNFYDCAWDYTSNAMYAVQNQDFYIWNIEDNTVEYIGSTDLSFEVLACDLNGELYGIAVGNPAGLYKIDKTDASLEFVGYTGQNCDYYWQSGALDYYNGKLYWTNSTDGTFVEVDLETGASTVLNTDLGENTSFCIPYEGGLFVLGAMIYRDNQLVGFTRDNSYLDEGNTGNHQYTIRVVYGGPAICPDNNIYCSMSCPQTVEIGGGSEITQTTNFSQGWNWWSTYIDQQGIDGLTTLEDGLGANGVQIKSQTDFVTNYGVFWMGMLQSINNDESYMIQTNAACQVEMSGLPVSPANHPITINQGWNWIGYPCTNTMSVTQAFANYTPMNGDQIKSQSDYAMYFSGIWIGQLQNITPGMGLMYKSNNTAPMTLVYPNAGRDEEAVAPKDLHWTNDVHAYPNNMTVLATVELDGVELSSESYELAAFADGECRGSAKLMFVEPLNRHVAFLTITGDEAVELTFALYDGENNVEYFDSDSRLVFTTNAVVGDAEAPFVVSFRGTTGLDELDNNVQIFPNPVQAGERISILTTVDSKHPIRVEIVNALGATVAYETSKDTPASIVAPMTSGIYTVRIITEDKGMQCRKLIVR